MLLAHSKCILFVTYFIALIYFTSYTALYPFVTINATALHIPRGTAGEGDKDLYSVVDWNHMSILAYQLLCGCKLESL